MSYILEALRKSERQRREIEAPPLVRLGACPGEPRKKRWRVAILVLSVIINLAALAFLVRYLVEREPGSAGESAVSSPSTINDVATSARAALDTSTGDVLEPQSKPLGFSEALPTKKPVGDTDEARIPRFRRPREATTAPPSKAAVARVPSPAASAAGPPSRFARNIKPLGNPEEAEDQDDVERVRRSRSMLKESTAPALSVHLPKASRAGGDESTVIESLRNIPDNDLPRPKINVYAYSASADRDRFVVIQSRKYHEGDRLEDGPLIRRIEETSITLDFQGQTYKVPRP